MKKFWIALIALGIALTGLGAWYFLRDKSDAVSYKTAKIERGNLQATVSASGAVNPVTQVSVGTQISGQIKELYVDFNSEVKAGQLIALIDPETFEYRLRQAQADVDAAKAALLTQQAGLAKARVDSDEAERDAQRKRQLVEKQFIAQSEAEKAIATARSLLEGLKVIEAQIKSAQATVAQREAAYAQARIDLTRTKITSPVGGIVIKRAIEKGQTVAASLQSPELFVIAQNLRDMQVDASIDESDVGRIRQGQRATFTVDAFPGQTFEGEVNQVRKAAQSVANVVTYVAVVRFSNEAGRLLPGMTANVRVVTDSREAVLKIPNSALRVKIAGIEPAAPAPAGPQAPASGAASQLGSGDDSLHCASLRYVPCTRPQLFAAYAQQGGGGGAMRERLVDGLGLNADQQTKLDAVLGELRPKFMAMRDMDDTERATAREKVTQEMRGKVNAFLTAEQKTKYLAMQQQAGQGGQRPSPQAGSPTAASSANPARPNVGSGAVNEAKRRESSPDPSFGRAVSGQAPSTTMSTPIPAPKGGVAPAITGQGPLIDVRNRLVAELQMPQSQADKLDAIYAAARPKYGALRDMPPEERGKGRDRISAEVRAQINDILTPEQKPRYAQLVAEAASRQGANSRGRIYLQGADGKPVAYNVRLGITDGTSTELMVMPNSPNSDKLIEGAVVITGVNAAGAGSAKPATGPRLPF
jgi:HlyD family secretion protein